MKPVYAIFEQKAMCPDCGKPSTVLFPLQVAQRTACLACAAKLKPGQPVTLYDPKGFTFSEVKTIGWNSRKYRSISWPDETKRTFEVESEEFWTLVQAERVEDIIHHFWDKFRTPVTAKFATPAGLWYATFRSGHMQVNDLAEIDFID